MLDAFNKYLISLSTELGTEVGTSHNKSNNHNPKISSYERK